MLRRVHAQEADRGQSASGQTWVEMVLLVPILLVILAAIIDMGRAIDAYIRLTNGVREGARYGALHPTDVGMIALRTANESSEPGTSFTRIAVSADHVSVHYPLGTASAGDPIRVQVDYDIPLYFGAFVGIEKARLSTYADTAILRN